jgi:type I restriction enzyme S subunit
MSDKIKLTNAVEFSRKRILSNTVSIERYITTDNLLQNKNGISIASNLPPSGDSMPMYEVNDILVSNIRPYLKKIWHATKYGGCSSDVLVFQTRKNFDSKFVYYNLFSDDFFAHMMKGAKGTKMPRGDKNQILEYLIPDFDKPTQQKIALVLSSLDSKIELNNRINAELEAMAKTLYDYWFVQFDFPNEKGKPYKSSGGKMVWNEELRREVPAGWISGTLSDLGEILGGSTPSREVEENFDKDGTPWITPKDLSENIGNKFIAKGEVSVSDKGLKSASLKLLPAGSVLMSSRAPVGYMAITRVPVTTNQGFKSFVPKVGYPTSFIFYTIKNAMPEIINNASGSTFKEISASTLKIIKVCLPKKEVVLNYSVVVESIFERQNILEIENQKLTELRDWLLPMLMNGQVKVG